MLLSAPRSSERGVGAMRRSWGRQWLGLTAALVTATAAFVAITAHHHQGAPQSPGPVHIAIEHLPEQISAAPAPTPITIGSGTSAVSCPTGAMPAVVLTNAVFAPLPVNGSDFVAGTYHIVLSGKVANDTTAAITISSLASVVDGAPWVASVSGPTTVAPGDAQPVTVTGDYAVTGSPQHPRFGLDMDWAWRNTRFVPCGKAGLVADD